MFSKPTFHTGFTLLAYTSFAKAKAVLSTLEVTNKASPLSTRTTEVSSWADEPLSNCFVQHSLSTVILTNSSAFVHLHGWIGRTLSGVFEEVRQEQEHGSIAFAVYGAR